MSKRIPNHLEDLARRFPEKEPLIVYIKSEYKRFAFMKLEEVRELLRHGELLKIYQRKERHLGAQREDREIARRIRVAS